MHRTCGGQETEARAVISLPSSVSDLYRMVDVRHGNAGIPSHGIIGRSVRRRTACTGSHRPGNSRSSSHRPRARQSRPRKPMQDIPLTMWPLTICTSYWIGVAIMVVRVRRRKHHFVGLVPEQASNATYVARLVSHGRRMDRRPLGHLDRQSLGACVAGFPVDLASVRRAALGCRDRGGDRAARHDPLLDSHGRQLADGRGRRRQRPRSSPTASSDIRHPIYSFSMLLSLCSVAIVPTLPMALIAAVNIALIVVKTRNEEGHLLAVHGEAYVRYSRGRVVSCRGSARARS